GYASHPRGDTGARARAADAVLPGLDLRALRPGARDAAEGDDAFLSPLAVRGGEALRLLDHGQLPRGLWPVCVQWDPVQPRVADSRRNLRHAEDHAGPGADQARPTGPALPGQSRRAARLGSCARLRRGAVADA